MFLQSNDLSSLHLKNLFQAPFLTSAVFPSQPYRQAESMTCCYRLLLQEDIAMLHLIHQHVLLILVRSEQATVGTTTNEDHPLSCHLDRFHFLLNSYHLKYSDLPQMLPQKYKCQIIPWEACRSVPILRSFGEEKQQKKKKAPATDGIVCTYSTKAIMRICIIFIKILKITKKKSKKTLSSLYSLWT